MISKNIKHLCLNYTQIENYNAAINDKSETWHCHHRLELRDDYINTREELKMMNLYYNRPPEELIFLKHSEHIKLHQNHEKRRSNYIKKVIKYPKKREALLKHYHGEDWTLEDKEQFVRERNTRHCRKSRDNHREAYTTYQYCYQQKFREENPYYYRTEKLE